MKEEYVPVRMSEAMTYELDEKILKLGIKGRSEAIRQAIKLFVNSDKPQLKKSLLKEFQEWRMELHNVGVNINQVAYKMNSGRPVSDEQIVRAQLELQDFFKQLVIGHRRIERYLLR